MGGYIPPWFWEGGDGQCFHPPLEMNEALSHLTGVDLRAKSQNARRALRSRDQHALKGSWVPQTLLFMSKFSVFGIIMKNPKIF